MALTTKEAIHGHKSQTHIFGCYSPSGGSGNTTVAQIIAHIKRRQGFKVFFLSFDIYPVYDDSYSSIQENDLSDYMIHLMTKTNWLMGLERIKSVDEISDVHYFKPGSSENDQQDFDQEVWLKWLSYMTDYSDYDCIILDLATRDVQKNTRLLAMCTSIVYMVRDDYFGHLKWLKYSEDMLRLGHQQLIEKGQIILNRVRPPCEGQELMNHCQLDYDEGIYLTSNAYNRPLNIHSRTYKSLEVLLNNGS
jgi:cellulose biosynthesis protein BcsQ